MLSLLSSPLTHREMVDLELNSEEMHIKKKKKKEKEQTNQPTNVSKKLSPVHFREKEK